MAGSKRSLRPVRVAVLGNSYAAYCQLPALRWAEAHGGPPVDVLAICGRDLDKAKATARRFDARRATTSLDDALEGDPDLVLVSTPVALHAPMVERALTTTRASVLCEKPFTLTGDQAARLAALARDAGQGGQGGSRLTLVDHQLRWSAPRRAFKGLIEAGAIGTVWVVRSEMFFGSRERLTRPASWWDQKAEGGGALLAIGSHLLDGLLWMFGPAVDVQARLTTCVASRLVDAPDVVTKRPVTADDHAELWLTHASGARSTMSCSVVHTHGRRALLEAVGEHGVLRLVDEDRLTLAHHDGRVEELPVRLASVQDVDACNDSAFARSEPLFLRDLLCALAEGAAALEGAATFDDAARVTAVLDAARR